MNWKGFHMFRKKNTKIVSVFLLVAMIGVAGSCSEEVDATQAIMLGVTENEAKTASVTLGKPSASTVAENGGTSEISVNLGSTPTGDVVIDFSASSSSEVSLSPSSLTFTPENWETTRSIKITGVDDSLDDGDVSVKITSSINTSSTADTTGYTGLASVESEAITVVDDDTSGISATTSSSSYISENGSTVTYSVTLTAKPTGNVTVTVSIPTEQNGEVTLSTTTLTFTPENWNVPQAVTVTGLDDSTTTGTISVPVSFDVDNTNTGDGNYAAISSTTSGKAPTKVDVTILDDDTTYTEDNSGSVTLPSTTSAGETLTYTATGATNGSCSIENGNLVYTPNANYAGTDTCSVVATVTNSSGVVTGTVNFNVSVTGTPVNDPPTIAGTPSSGSSGVSGYSWSPTSGDVDGDTTTFSITSGSLPPGLTINSSTGEISGTPTTPGTYSFTITVSDGNGGTTQLSTSITIANSSNNTPVATAQAVSTSEDTAKAITLAGTDADSGDTLTFAIGTSPAHGTLSGFNSSTGAVTYTPSSNYNGSDSFTFTVNDGTATSSAATVSITVSAVNDTPSATAQAVSTNEDTAKAITLAGTDVDSGDTLTFAIGTSPAHGTLSGLNTSTGAVTYTPSSNYNGSDSFTFTVNDGTVTSSAATVTITVSAVNDTPSATAQAVSTNEDTAKAITLAGTDVDSGDTLTFAIGTSPSHGALSGLNTSTGAVTYTPSSNYNGSDSFTFTVNDGTATSSAATVTITITAVNDAPTISGTPTGATNGSAYSWTPTSDDVEGDTKSFSITSGSLPPGLTINASTGAISGTPSATGTYSFTITVSDGNGGTTELATSITVSASGNSTPVATAQAVSTSEDTAKAITLAGTDADSGDTLTFAIGTSPAHGTLSGLNTSTGAVTYTPSSNYNGSDSFTFTVNDGTATSSAATVTITITAVNDAPVASGVTASTNEDTAKSITLSYTDVEGNQATSCSVGTPSSGTISTACACASGTCTVGITPDANATAQITASYTVSDGDTSNSATLTLNITPVLDISSAATLDSDGNGKIDHMKVTFDGNVDDSTFPGYTSHGSAGSVTTLWQIAGYSNVKIVTGASAPAGETDTVDDTVIYLSFTEGSSYDTGAKPDLTTSASAGLQGLTGGVELPQVSSGTVTESDSASPRLVSAAGEEGGTSLVVGFSEAVYGDTGSAACSGAGDLVAGDFTYTDGNSSAGATGVSSLSEACGSDSSVTLTLNAGMVTGDSADSIAPKSGSYVYDAANNTGLGSANPSITANTAPSISSLTQTGSNSLQIVFSEAMDTTATTAAGNYKLVSGKTLTGSASDNTNFTGSTAAITLSSVSGSGTTYTLTFASGFASDTWYTLVLDRAETTDSFIKDAIGKAVDTTNYKTFFNDTTGPYLVNVSGEACGTTTNIYIETSEEVANLTTSDTMTSGLSTQMSVDGSNDSTTCTADLPSASITASKNSGSTKELTVSANSALCTKFYQLRLRNPNNDGTHCSSATCMKDSAGNTPSTPATFTFYVNEQLRVINAQAVENSITDYKKKVDVVFNKPVKQLSVECSGSTACNKLYYISGMNITSASLIGSRKVRLTTDTDQTGKFYTVVVNNGSTTDNPTGWTTEDTANPIQSDSTCSTGESVSAYPYDRFAFQGSGTAVTSVDDFFFDDPFQDGAKFVFAFAYKGQVYVGPNDKNNVTFRFEPTGFNQSLAGFEFASPTCTTPYGFGYIQSGYTIYDTNKVDCGTGADNSGPASEVGVVGFNSMSLTVNSTAYEMMGVGTLKPNVANLYYTTDTDNMLTYKSVAITGANGTNTASIQTIVGKNNMVFIAIPSDHGTNAPVFNRYTASEVTGGLELGAAYDMSGNYLGYLGKANNTNSNNNSNGVVGIDSITFFNDAMYLSNNAGVVYLDTSANRGDTKGWDGSPSSNDTKTIYTLASPTTFNASNDFTKWAPAKEDSSGTRNDAGGLGKTRPGEKGIPIMKEHNGKLYMVRNVSIAGDQTDADSFADTGTTRKAGSASYYNGQESYYGELWMCDPASGSDTGRSAQICESDDWTLLLSGRETELGGATPTSDSISMLEFVGDTAYIGFDGPSAGVRIFAMKLAGGDIVATNGASTSFDKDGDSTWDNGEWKQAGTDGLGSVTRNKYIFSSSTITDTYGDTYLFVNVADDSSYAIRVYRQLGEYQPL